ncbi:MAG: 50S ribosomal protein L29 [Methanonatronarchaeales archaeon]|nr:50S ribosomal protein L29 [Methanonatronarchaeales archaeon]
MAIIRISEIREMTPNERAESLQDLSNELLRERASAAAGGMPENPGRIRELRRTIARIETVEREGSR